MHLPDFVVLHLLRHGKTSLGTLGLVLKSQFVDGSGSLSFAEATEGSLRARAAYTAHHGPQTSWSLDFSPLYASEQGGAKRGQVPPNFCQLDAG